MGGEARAIVHLRAMGCLEIFWLLPLHWAVGGGCIPVHPLVDTRDLVARDAAQHPRMLRAICATSNNLTPNINRAKTEEP